MPGPFIPPPSTESDRQGSGQRQKAEVRFAPPRPLRILGLGRALPAEVVPSSELESRFGVEPGWIERTTGVRERRRADVDRGELASELGARAAREALDEADLELRDVDLIVNASGTPEQAIPDGGPLLQRALGLERSGIPAFSVHATCLSFLVALDVVASMVASGGPRRVLVVSSDLGSFGVYGVDPKSECLFGDAAAAAVVGRAEEGDGASLERYLHRTWSQGAGLTEIPGAGTRRHPLRPGASPDDLRFHMHGPGVLQLSMRRAGPFLDALVPGLRSDGMDGRSADERIDLAVTHQPSRAGLEALSRFGIEPARTVTTLGSLGNCVAASLPCTLYEAARSGRLQRGDRVLLFGTGAGLSMAGALLRY